MPHPLMTELGLRWQAMFAALVAGDDVPPAQRLRTEGMMEAAALLDAAPIEDILAAMDACYRAAYGCGIAQDFGDQWQDFYPFPQIPAMGKRAPVFPSTSD